MKNGVREICKEVGACRTAVDRSIEGVKSRYRGIGAKALRKKAMQLDKRAASLRKLADRQESIEKRNTQGLSWITK